MSKVLVYDSIKRGFKGADWLFSPLEVFHSVTDKPKKSATFNSEIFVVNRNCDISSRGHSVNELRNDGCASAAIQIKVVPRVLRLSAIGNMKVDC
jgi:hypothetical protein